MDYHAPSPEPGARTPAPGNLRIVQAFLNTVDIESGEEALGDPAGLASWLGERHLLEPGARLTEADLRQAVAFRETLRALAYANHDDVSDPSAVAALNRIASGARLRIAFDEAGGATLEPDVLGLDGALARLLAIVYAAMGDGSWSRFKACRNDTCRWVFYDRSRNRSSSWCSMAICGNRQKARAYRRRRSTEPA